MKQQLWQLNSALLVLLTVLLIFNFFLLRKQPTTLGRIVHPKDIFGEEGKKIIPEDIELIYAKDLFDTYRAPEEVAMPLALISPIPEPTIPTTMPAPEIKKPQLLPPLALTLKGVLFSANTAQSVALLEDETSKELSYYNGDSVKDGQIIKISKERVTILRANGQHETLLLKKDELTLKKDINGWGHVLQKDNTTTLVDPYQLTKAIPSLGHTFDNLSLATAFQHGKPVGVQVGSVPANSIYNELGLKKGDIITAINTIPLENTKDRFKAYQQIRNAKINDSITISLSRDATPMTMEYTLAHLEPIPLLPPFGTLPQQHSGLFSMNKQQQRTQNQRVFNKEHQIDREQTIENMRKRIFENMRKREANTRIR